MFVSSNNIHKHHRTWGEDDHQRDSKIQAVERHCAFQQFTIMEAISCLALDKFKKMKSKGGFDYSSQHPLMQHMLLKLAAHQVKNQMEPCCQSTFSLESLMKHVEIECLKIIKTIRLISGTESDFKEGSADLQIELDLREKIVSNLTEYLNSYKDEPIIQKIQYFQKQYSGQISSGLIQLVQNNPANLSKALQKRSKFIEEIKKLLTLILKPFRTTVLFGEMSHALLRSISIGILPQNSKELRGWIEDKVKDALQDILIESLVQLTINKYEHSLHQSDGHCYGYVLSLMAPSIKKMSSAFLENVYIHSNRLISFQKNEEFIDSSIKEEINLKLTYAILFNSKKLPSLFKGIAIPSVQLIFPETLIEAAKILGYQRNGKQPLNFYLKRLFAMDSAFINSLEPKLAGKMVQIFSRKSLEELCHPISLNLIHTTLTIYQYLFYHITNAKLELPPDELRVLNNLKIGCREQMEQLPSILWKKLGLSNPQELVDSRKLTHLPKALYEVYYAYSDKNLTDLKFEIVIAQVNKDHSLFLQFAPCLFADPNDVDWLTFNPNLHSFANFKELIEYVTLYISHYYPDYITFDINLFQQKMSPDDEQNSSFDALMAQHNQLIKQQAEIAIKIDYLKNRRGLSQELRDIHLQKYQQQSQEIRFQIYFFKDNLKSFVIKKIEEIKNKKHKLKVVSYNEIIDSYNKLIS